MIIPGLDLMRLFIIRIYNGKNPFTPDRKHLHHILLSKHNIYITNRKQKSLQDTSLVSIQLKTHNLVLIYSIEMTEKSTQRSTTEVAL